MASTHPVEREMTEEERQKYDRAGFIGHQVQKRLLVSNILIENMTGSNTELAKNLILAGANITIVDASIIGERDTDTNFIFTKQQLGLKRGEEAQKELKLINPLVKIEWLEQFPNEDQLGCYNALVTSRTNFEEMIEIDNLSEKHNIPYYNLVCCGYYGFMYIGLGTKFIYEREKKVVLQIVFGKKQDEKEQYREYEEVIASSVPLINTLNYKYKSQGMVTNLIYYCLLMMKKAQENPELKTYDPYQPNEQLLDQFAKLGTEIYKNATEKDATEEQIQTFRNFAKFYGIDYCPVYSVIGSVASQELIISTSRINEPGINWFCYDSQASYGQVEVIQDIQSFPTKDLPERKQLITKD